MNNQEASDQRFRDLFTATAGRMWSQRGIRLVSIRDDASFDECELDLDENSEILAIEPGDWSQLVVVSADLGVDLTKF